MTIKKLAAWCRKRCESGSGAPCDGCKMRQLCRRVERIAERALVCELVALIEEDGELEEEGLCYGTKRN